ncbi:hypothetical protein [Paraburkholderia tropica]|uniref:hypothetical protein n=1 Tax=Paraburkholderia tropica TaxID=92647 RepID=UPI002AB662CE|nr:hypothetical protein [Paraburkholderia tropica]
MTYRTLRQQHIIAERSIEFDQPVSLYEAPGYGRNQILRPHFLFLYHRAMICGDILQILLAD